MAGDFVSTGVRARVIDGHAVLLVIDSGDYVVLDRIATWMWEALTTQEAKERLGFLTSRIAGDVDRLTNDLEAFRKECHQLGYLSEAPPPAQPRQVPARRARPPSAVAAWLTLLAVNRRLRAGFAGAYRHCLDIAKPDLPADAGAIARAEAAFLSAENVFIHRAAPRDCLPRSLALYSFLARCGIRADHCIGVSRFPFEAHAWVECEGRILLDRPEWVKLHAELARI